MNMRDAHRLPRSRVDRSNVYLLAAAALAVIAVGLLSWWHRAGPLQTPAEDRQPAGAVPVLKAVPSGTPSPGNPDATASESKSVLSRRSSPNSA